MRKLFLILVGAVLFSLRSFAQFPTSITAVPPQGRSPKMSQMAEGDSSWGTVSRNQLYVVTPSGFKFPPGPGEGAGIVVSPFMFEIKGTPLTDVTVILGLPDAFTSAGTSDSLPLTNWTYVTNPDLPWCEICVAGPIIGDSVTLPTDDSGKVVLAIGATLFVPLGAFATNYTAAIKVTFPGGMGVSSAVGRLEETSVQTTDTTVRRYIEVLDVTDVSNRNALPLKMAFDQNYPNPFNPSTNIKFSVAHAGEVNIKVFDMLGREVATLVNERKEPGEYSVQWNAENVPSGVYYYQIIAGDFVQTKKMVVMR